MRSPDLHPDELLDKAKFGEISAAERTQLDEHLASCAVCRFEMSAQNDFELQLSCDHDHAAIDDLVTRALLGAKADPERAERRSMRPRKRTATFLVAAVAAVVSMASVAAAARITGIWKPKADVVPMLVVPSAAPSLAPTTRAHGRAKGREENSEALLDESAPTAVDENAVESAPRVIPEQSATTTVAPPIARRVPAIAARSAVATRAPEQPSPASPTAPTAEKLVERDTAPSTATALFADANNARVRGAHAEAIAKYRDLLRTFPSAPEARLTRVTLGKLLLDRGDAASALDELDDYLRSGDGTLREEALTAKALALAKIGRSAEESSTWNQLIQSYPQSVRVARAKARLSELGPR